MPYTKIRLRLIIINQNKLLTTYAKDQDFYFYVGGKLEYGETIAQGAMREIAEECGADTTFKLNKFLYVRDYIIPEEGEHSVELYILGSINKFHEIEGYEDPQDHGNQILAWLDLDKLPHNLYPHQLSSILLQDYQSNFNSPIQYIGILK